MHGAALEQELRMTEPMVCGYASWKTPGRHTDRHVLVLRSYQMSSSGVGAESPVVLLVGMLMSCLRLENKVGGSRRTAE